MTIPKKVKIASLILKAVVFLSAAAGVIFGAMASRGTFMGGGRVFMFFTIQSNIAIGLIEGIGAVFLLKRSVTGRLWSVIRFIGTVSITLTGAVFCVLLAPTLGDAAWSATNLLTHVVVPVASIADFFVTGPYGAYRKSDVWYVVLPPLAYTVYAVIGYVAGWEFVDGANYPYFFFNWGSPAGAFSFSRELPFMGCVWWILLLLAFLIFVGWVYLRIAFTLRKKAEKKTVSNENAILS